MFLLWGKWNKKQNKIFDIFIEEYSIEKNIFREKVGETSLTLKNTATFYDF